MVKNQTNSNSLTSEIEKSEKNHFSITFSVIEKKILSGRTVKIRYLARVVRRLSLTCGARYETSRRHKRKHRMSNVSIMILSMYAILFAIMSNLESSTDDSRELFSMLGIFMSSFIVAFTLFESSKRYDARSESFLRCAVDMQALRDEATYELYREKCDWEKIWNIEERYNKLLITYTDNHARIDYLSHRYSIGKLDRTNASRYHMKYFGNILVFPIISFFSPIIVILLYSVVKFLFSV